MVKSLVGSRRMTQKNHHGNKCAEKDDQSFGMREEKAEDGRESADYKQKRVMDINRVTDKNCKSRKKDLESEYRFDCEDEEVTFNVYNIDMEILELIITHSDGSGFYSQVGGEIGCVKQERVDCRQGQHRELWKSSHRSDGVDEKAVGSDSSREAYKKRSFIAGGRLVWCWKFGSVFLDSQTERVKRTPLFRSNLLYETGELSESSRCPRSVLP
ncbi:Os02g0544800 [Oryza sativa Japonica Group]|uniref:Os02g0544800 protein n=1 Tax=Oryza sativa subsp. japonica TaxID=39947 RepID=A0A0P0VK53_ORYSJ|nr:Os02g0544800 [Oryza sativa Japonica Group]